MYVVFFRLQTLVPNHNLVIASYDIVRNDIDFFRYILTLHIRTWNNLSTFPCASTCK